MKLIFDSIGLPCFTLGFLSGIVPELSNIDNGKSVILSLIGASWLVIKIYWYHKRQDQAYREKEIEIQEKIKSNKAA